MGLRGYPYLLNCSYPVHKRPIYLRGLFLGNLQSEGNAENGRQSIHNPASISPRDCRPFGIIPHFLAPHVTKDIMIEIRPYGIRRGREALYKIRHLILGEITCLRLATKAHSDGKYGDK